MEVTPVVRPTPLERPYHNVNIDIYALISSLMRGHPSWKATFLVQNCWPHKRGSTVLMNFEWGWCMIQNGWLWGHLDRDCAPIYCPLQRKWSSVFTPFPPRIEPQAVTWQSITQTLHHASFIWYKMYCVHILLGSLCTRHLSYIITYTLSHN